jgi:hypothetical protein
MEIKDAEKTIDQADSFLTKLKNLLKKHWGILLILLVGYFIYWSLTTDFPEETNNENTINEENNIEPHIIDGLYEIDENGDTVYIDIYSDGTRDEYY